MPRPSPARILAAATWSAPVDPSVLGMVDVEYGPAERFLTRYNARFGSKVTPTHLVGRAVALLAKKHPETNAIIGWRSIRLRERADVFFMIDSEAGRNVTGHKVEAADTVRLADLEARLSARAEAIRAGHDAEFGESHDSLRRTPLWLARPMAKLFIFLSRRLGIDLGPKGPAPDPMGGTIVTSLAKFGFELGFAALPRFSEAGFLVAIMPVREMPWVVGDKVEPRAVLRLCCTSDHRIVDGHSGGVMLSDLKALLMAPEDLLTEAERADWDDAIAAPAAPEA